MPTITKRYGEWVSPITSAVATTSAAAYQALTVYSAEDDTDTVFWCEMRYDEAGRCVIMSHDVGKSGNQMWTPKEFSARTLVHEYGGGSFFVSSGVVYFSNFADQRLYKQTGPESTPVAITPVDTHWRYADGEMSTKTGKIYIVREDHSKVKSGHAGEATNSLVCINPVTEQQTVIACGADFYSSPRVSPDGTKICWVQWNHPNMPWDSTEIWTGQLNDSRDGVVDGTATKVVGGDDTSVMHPSWNPSGELFYVSDETNWWNLYQLGSDGKGVTLCLQDKELGGPAWQFAKDAYATNANRPGEVAVAYGGMQLSVLKKGKLKSLATGYEAHSNICLSGSGKIYCIASSPVKFTSIISVNVDDGQVELINQCQSLNIAETYYSKFTEICYPTSDNQKSYAYYYPPSNPDYEAPAGDLPPLLVKAHGGPTSSASASLQLKIQYFTSRGFAVLDVNYRGSTGYGREYRMLLKERWGICDVEDCCAGALYLAADKKVDKNRLCIDGGSAGGYTTLACLAFKDVFKAGASHFGIADLELLAQETHKFESRYTDKMIGPYPVQKAVYIERSPIHHIEGFNSPIIFFQGTEDAVVPPNQAEMMYKSVNDKKIPCALVMFEGEQHGFTKSENIRLSVDGELYFFAKILGFVPPGLEYVATKITISNL